jgi:hypothetical protein
VRGVTPNSRRDRWADSIAGSEIQRSCAWRRTMTRFVNAALLLGLVVSATTLPASAQNRQHTDSWTSFLLATVAATRPAWRKSPMR